MYIFKLFFSIDMLGFLGCNLYFPLCAFSLGQAFAQEVGMWKWKHSVAPDGVCVFFLVEGWGKSKEKRPFFFVLGSCQLSTNYSCIFLSTFWLIPKISMDVPKDYMILSMRLVFLLVSFGWGLFPTWSAAYCNILEHVNWHTLLFI